MATKRCDLTNQNRPVDEIERLENPREALTV